MLTGVSYMGHHNPAHIKTDIVEMKDLGLDDVLLAAQENDFRHFTGKIKFTPKIAEDHGIRPIAIFWGALNLFGGGKSSQFLLEHPEGSQVDINGNRRPAGCYVNSSCVSQIESMVDKIAEHGFKGYFIDEPTPLVDCYCQSCRDAFRESYGGDLSSAPDHDKKRFRHICVIDYVKKIAAYSKSTHPQLETMCCLMPSDQEMWAEAAKIPDLDNLGTDIYWVNNDRNVEEMEPLIDKMGTICKQDTKVHHEWLQCCAVRKGNERRVFDQGRVLVEKNPDALYIWAWKGQIGTTESCDDHETSWKHACDILRMAKQQ